MQPWCLNESFYYLLDNRYHSLLHGHANFYHHIMLSQVAWHNTLVKEKRKREPISLSLEIAWQVKYWRQLGGPEHGTYSVSMFIMVGLLLGCADVIRGHTTGVTGLRLYILWRNSMKGLIKKLQTGQKEYRDGRMDMGTVSKNSWCRDSFKSLGTVSKKLGIGVLWSVAKWGFLDIRSLQWYSY